MYLWETWYVNEMSTKGRIVLVSSSHEFETINATLCEYAAYKLDYCLIRRCYLSIRNYVL